MVEYSGDTSVWAPAEFAGVPDTTLQAWLTDAQTALQTLTTGGKAVSLFYNSGAGHKSVTYTPADMGMLRQRVQDLARALGLVPRRRAMRPGF